MDSFFLSFVGVCVCVFVGDSFAGYFVWWRSSLLSLLCIYQTNRNISILFLIVIYNCKYIFSREKDQIFYCFFLCVHVCVIPETVRDLMMQQLKWKPNRREALVFHWGVQARNLLQPAQLWSSSVPVSVLCLIYAVITDQSLAGYSQYLTLQITAGIVLSFLFFSTCIVRRRRHIT